MSDNDVVSREAAYRLADDLWHLMFNLQEDGDCIDMDEVAEKIHELAKLSPVEQPMSAVEYLKVRERMASELGELCSACHCEGKCWDCPYHTPDTEDEMKCPDRSVALVEKWAREHPERRSE